MGSRTTLGDPALPGPLQQTSLNVPASKLRYPELTRLAVADSKESSEPFPGSCIVDSEMRFGQRRGCLVEWWQILLSPSHSNILDVIGPQTNSDSVCVSLCAGQGLFDTVYLLVE